MSTVVTNSSADTVLLGQLCVAQPNATVTLVVTTTGTIVITSQVAVAVDHRNGNVDYWSIMHGRGPADCTGIPDAWVGNVPGSLATDVISVTASVQSSYRTGPGTFTFWLTGLENSAPPNTVSILRSTTVAVFYPDG